MTPLFLLEKKNNFFFPAKPVITHLSFATNIGSVLTIEMMTFTDVLVYLTALNCAAMVDRLGDLRQRVKDTITPLRTRNSPMQPTSY